MTWQRACGTRAAAADLQDHRISYSKPAATDCYRWSAVGWEPTLDLGRNTDPLWEPLGPRENSLVRAEVGLDRLHVHCR